jgi:hypothetical protein
MVKLKTIIQFQEIKRILEHLPTVQMFIDWQKVIK